MPAAYDKYDYPSYWSGRSYEHNSEVLVIKDFLSKIPKIKRFLDLGCGYGRLCKCYRHRAEKIILADPSSGLLKIARGKLKAKNVEFIHSTIDKVGNKLRTKSVDVVLLVRVLHHMENLDKVFTTVNTILKKDGYFIVEFANKQHFKAQLKELFRGNFTFLLDIFPKDIRTSKRKKTIPFINYHPDSVIKKLKDSGFKIMEIRSVSNVRSSFLKRIIPWEALLSFEKYLQKPLAKLYFGPSIFILAKK